MQRIERFTVFEHEALYTNKGDKRLSPEQLKSFQLFHKEKNFPYYSLLHNGVRFCEYVGVICVGRLSVEVLPKADRSNDYNHWKGVLVDMMRSTGIISPEAPSYSELKLKSFTILDLYVELFLTEIELLMRKGLIKKYRSKESNSYALSGKLIFSKQIVRNNAHLERFWIEQTVYDQAHLLHRILYKALKTVMGIGLNSTLSIRCAKVILEFPEQADVNIVESVFQFSHDRKSKSYEKAIGIARIILLNFHPDLSKGSSNALALMFDMNKLWEKFVFRSLQRFAKGFIVRAQEARDFWSGGSTRPRLIKPDIIIEENNKVYATLDTKWKIVRNFHASDEDLKQLYVYSRYTDNSTSFLIYPGDITDWIVGTYCKTKQDVHPTFGGVATMELKSGKRIGQHELCRQILDILATCR